MANENRRFGDLLTIGIRAISARQDKPIGVLQDEIGFQLGREGRTALDYWRRGNVPAEFEQVETLGRLCVTQGGLDQAWLSDFLRSARHPLSKQIIESLFVEQVHTIKQIPHNLPRQDYPQFVGRQQELDKIAEWLHPNDRSWLLTIDGVGGIGKTTLALEAAYQLKEQRSPFNLIYPYETIVWVSAKQETLHVAGRIPRTDYFRNLTDIYTAIADVLEHEDVIRALPEDQGRLVKRILTKKPILLIVDNLESVSDETVYSFLRHDLPFPSKAMITTRRKIDVAQSIRVIHFDTKETWELINHEAQEKNVVFVEQSSAVDQLSARQQSAKHIVLTQDQKEKLHQRTGGIPFVISLTVAQIARGYPIDRVLANYGKVNDDLLNYCLQFSFESLRTRDARQVLIALSLFAVDASQNSLCAVAGFEQDELSFQEALVELDQLSLIDVHHDPTSYRYATLPITRDFVRHLVTDNEEKKIRERQAEYYLELFLTIGSDYTPSNWQKFNKLDPERENIFDLMTYLYENEAYTLVIRFTYYLWGYLSFRGYWSNCLIWVEHSEKAAQYLQQTNEFEVEAKTHLGFCLNEKSWIQINLNRREQARGTIRQAMMLFDEVNEKKGKAIALRHLGVLEKNEQNFADANEYYSKSLDIWKSINDEREIAGIYNNLGSLAIEQKKFRKATDLLEKALEIKKKLNDIPRLGNTLYYLGEAYFNLRQIESSKAFLLQACDIAKSCGEILYQAKSYECLAKLYTELDEVQAANSAKEKSIILFEHIGINIEKNIV